MDDATKICVRSRTSSRAVQGFHFSLAEMLLLLAVVAVVCRWPMLVGLLGSIVACAVAGKFRFDDDRIVIRRYFYRTVLPLVWLTAAATSWHRPGDEYGLFIVSALPASWIMVFPQAQDIRSILPLVFAAGAVVVALCGWALDRLRVRLRLFAPLLVSSTVALVLFALCQYPSYQRAMMKNGSLTAYVSSGLNLGLYLATISSYAMTVAVRIVQTISRHRAVQQGV